jgi:hypothetical protein
MDELIGIKIDSIILLRPSELDNFHLYCLIL